MRKPDSSKVIFREQARSQKPKPRAVVEHVVEAEQDGFIEPEAKARSHTAESGYGADPGPEHWAECASEVSGFMLAFNAELVDRLAAIDRMIVEYGKLLNDSQPGISGKILVRWWKTGARGRAGGTTPVFMVLYRNRSGRLSGRKLDGKNITKKARTSGSFAINHEPAVEILATLANLFEMRAKIFNELGKYKRVLSAMKAKDGNMVFIGAKSQELRKQISDNMRNASPF